ncbi:MAG: hypothetical protein JWM15_281 [Cryptosporangiaceae bacterium]|jgi:hypothetical protein|nr:hypothetical protein [Cryptosporangiaceae bacterium]
MLHTVRNPLRLVRQGAERMLVIGPTRDAVLLEFVIVDPEGDPRDHPRNAMPTEFLRLL